MVETLATFMASLTVELGYPCSHRRMKRYVSEDGIDNFTRLWERYCLFVEAAPDNQRVMTYVTFTKYAHAYHPDVAIQRAKEDSCDTCIRLAVAVADPNLSLDQKEMLLEAQRTHADEAKTQRLALKSAIKVR